jgi:hypothetical protein
MQGRDGRDRARRDQRANRGDEGEGGHRSRRRRARPRRQPRGRSVRGRSVNAGSSRWFVRSASSIAARQKLQSQKQTALAPIPEIESSQALARQCCIRGSSRLSP